MSVLPDLHRPPDGRPQLRKPLGDAAWVAEAGGTSVLTRESPARQVAAMKAELAGPDAPSAGRLLAERAAICWLQSAQAGGQGLSAPQLNPLVGHQTEAHARYAEHGRR